MSNLLLLSMNLTSLSIRVLEISTDWVDEGAVNSDTLINPKC